MGDGKITLECLGSCEAIFDITILQKALKPDMFSKWFRKIQMAEIGEVNIIYIFSYHNGSIILLILLLYYANLNCVLMILGRTSRT